jgi:TetR/AcrR family transcriptional regulator, cholesterol catabolism regulator
MDTKPKKSVNEKAGWTTTAPAPARKTTGRKAPVRAQPAGSAAKSTSLQEDRKGQLLEEAARLFGTRGYERTSMRDIADAFGILPGSLYHHFGSKDELFAAVYAQGVTQFIAAVQRALGDSEEPWERLEAACVAHLDALVARNSSTAAVFADWSTFHSEELRAALVKERDRYEVLFSSLVAAVPLPDNISRQYFRLSLLGALNWALTWFRPGKDSPSKVAREMLAVFRSAL